MNAIPAAPPLTPDGDEARDAAERVLSRREFDAAEPTPLDLLAQAIGEALESLLGAEAPPALGAAILVGAAVVVLALIAVAFVVWGPPRVAQRSGRPAPALFDDDDDRSADALRAEAEASAAASDWDRAVVLRFRALARGTLERGVIDLAPGATVHAFARAATAAFPAQSAALEAAADAFDDVRYLRRPASADRYERVASADRDVAAARPASAGAPAPDAAGAPR